MKNLCILCFLSLAFSFSSAQDNLDISTLRIGPFTIFMKSGEMEKITQSKFIVPKNSEEYFYNKSVKYLGETIDLSLSQNTSVTGGFDGTYKIHSLSTKSKKFRTKSGMRVGSTKKQLFEAYKNYPNFCSNQSWDEKTGKISSTNIVFTLTDNDAGTVLNFILVNNTVVEIAVYINDGC